MSRELEQKQGDVLTGYFCHSQVAVCLTPELFLSWQLALVIIRVIPLNMTRDTEQFCFRLFIWAVHCPPLYLTHRTGSSFMTKGSLIRLPSLCEKSMIRIWGAPKSAWWRHGKHVGLHGNAFTSTLQVRFWSGGQHGELWLSQYLQTLTAVPGDQNHF